MKRVLAIHGHSQCARTFRSKVSVSHLDADVVLSMYFLAVRHRGCMPGRHRVRHVSYQTMALWRCWLILVLVSSFRGRAALSDAHRPSWRDYSPRNCNQHQRPARSRVVALPVHYARCAYRSRIVRVYPDRVRNARTF